MRICSQTVTTSRYLRVTLLASLRVRVTLLASLQPTSTRVTLLACYYITVIVMFWYSTCTVYRYYVFRV